MNITSMTVSNFRGIKDEVTIDFKPITLLFGPNSAGKSSIIQALHYAWEVIGRKNLSPKSTEYGGQAIDFGGFENIVNEHDKNKSITMKFNIDLNSLTLKKYADENYIDGLSIGQHKYTNVFLWNPSEIAKKLHTAGVEFTIFWDDELNEFRVSNYKTYINDELISVINSSNGEKKSYINYINFCHPVLVDTVYKKDIIDCLTDEKNDFICNEEMNIEFLKKLCNKPRFELDHWLDENILSENDYKHFKNLISYIFKIEKQLPINKKFIHKSENEEKVITKESIWDNDKLSYEEKKEISDKLKKIWDNDKLSYEEKKEISDKLKKINEKKINFLTKQLEKITKNTTEIYKIFAPYEFWLYCRLFFGFKSLNDQISIECIGQKDALPDFESLLSIKPSTDENDLIDELNNSDFYFEGIRSAISQIILSPGKILYDELKKLIYIGPIRSRVSRSYEPDTYIDNKKWSEGLAAWDVIHKKDNDFLINLNYWMDNRLHTGYKIKKQKNAKIKIVNKNNFEFRPIDVGVGISQILPVIVCSLYSEQGIICIEQPELHIHPALQVEIGDLFLAQVEEKNLCFLIETHSEHLLLRILKRIRQSSESIHSVVSESKFTPEIIAVYFVENSGYGTKATKIRIDEEGEFADRWPKGFFEERILELI